MPLWRFLLIIGGFGAAGGLVAYLTSSGWRWRIDLADGPKEASWLNAFFTGAGAAVLAWCLMPGHDVLPLRGTVTTKDELTIKAAVAAVGAGLSGSKWLTNHYQAKVYAFAGEQAALNPQDPTLATAIASQDPARIKNAL